MTDKQINKWLRRRFSPVGWVLVAYYALMNAMAVLGLTLEELQQWMLVMMRRGMPEDMNWDAVYGNAWGYVLTVLIFLAVLSAWKGRDYWRQELLVRKGRMTADTAISVLILCMGAQMLSSLWITLLEGILNSFGGSVMPVLEAVSGSSDTFSMFLYASLLAPLGEEILFRGFVLRSLEPYGKRFAIGFSAVLFALFHGNLLQAPYALIMGLILGWLTLEYSLWWSLGLHLFNNLVLADLLTRLTASWSDAAFGMLNAVLFGTSAVISMVILAVKWREIREYRRSEGIDRRCVKCLISNPGILVMGAIALVNMISMFWL